MTSQTMTMSLWRPKNFLKSLCCALSFRCEVSTEIENKSRRNFGLAFLGLTALLSTWQWTLGHANYSMALRDFMTAGGGKPNDALVDAINWSLGFFAVDTLLYIGCYLGFGILLCRQLERLIDKDLTILNPDAPLPPEHKFKLNPRTYHRFLTRVAWSLLWALVVVDAVENVSAFLILWSKDASNAVAKVYSFAHATKLVPGGLALLWIGVGSLIWVTG